MKGKIMLAAALSCALLFSGCMPSGASGIEESAIVFRQFEEVEEGADLAVVHTTLGDITMVLYPKEAPQTVAHFKKLVESGFYTDLPLFAQIGSRTVVTGASDEFGAQGELLTEDEKPLASEVTPNLWHFSGAVSALGVEKNQFSQEMVSDSRFFFVGTLSATTEMVTEMEKYQYPLKVIDAYKEHGGLPQYTGSYTVFGQVIDGMEIVDKLAKAEISADNGQVLDGRLLSIELTEYHAEEAGSASSDTE